MSLRKIEEKQLKKILAKHVKWLTDPTKGERADLRSANLGSANLSYVNLLIFQFNRNTAYFTLDGTLRIGCERMPISEWVLGYQEIGEKQGYSEIEIEAYGDFIRTCLKVFNSLKPKEG